jgi:hypothetical protein
MLFISSVTARQRWLEGYVAQIVIRDPPAPSERGTATAVALFKSVRARLRDELGDRFVVEPWRLLQQDAEASARHLCLGGH